MCACEANNDHESKFKSVSFIELIAHPERYNNAKIRTIGYFHCKYEDVAIYLSNQDGDHLVGENAFWIRFSKETNFSCSKKEYDMKIVVVNGIFSSNEKGHMGAYAGSITDVKDIQLRRKWY